MEIEKSASELGHVASHRNCKCFSSRSALTQSSEFLQNSPSVRFPTRCRNTISNACSLQSAPSLLFYLTSDLRLLTSDLRLPTSFCSILGYNCLIQRVYPAYYLVYLVFQILLISFYILIVGT